MTVRKKDNLLRGDRTPKYVSRETGAAELQISPNTWDQWVKDGRLPISCGGFPDGTPRWRWEDVDRKLSGQATASTTDLAIKATLNFGKKGKSEPIHPPGSNGDLFARFLEREIAYQDLPPGEYRNGMY